jgi:DNA-directed RNA polymerase II subunit RPB2
MEKDALYNFTWDVIKTYFSGNNGSHLVKHLVDSYNDFVLRKLEQIIEGFNPIDICSTFLPEHDCFKYTLSIEIKNPVMSKPTIYEKDGSTKLMTPNDARLRNFTYAAPLLVEVHITCRSYDEAQKKYNIETKRFQHVSLGKIPVMVRSKYCILSNHTIEDECPHDMGGYFIVNGNEKVVISQDRIAENKTYVFVNNKVSCYSHVAEIRSVADNKFSVPKTTSLKLSVKPSQFGRYIRVNIHHVKHDIPLFILFRALGVESDHEILEYIIHNFDNPNSRLVMEELVGSIEEASCCTCQRDALEYIVRYLNISGHPKEFLSNKSYRQQVLSNVLQKEFLPHVGSEFDKKALYLGYMTCKLLKCYLGLLPFDDRDSYINKRVDTPGVLMANLFRQYFGKVVKDMRNMIQKDINNGAWKATNKFIHVINKVNITKIVKSTIIESGMKYGLATGNWGIKTNKTKQGVAQVLNRMTYNATLSHMRRVNTPIEKSGKLVQPRKLHGTQWGIICPSETPEGASVGLVKNMAIMSGITIYSSSVCVRELLQSNGVAIFKDGNIQIFKEGTKVFLNGDLVGCHAEPHKLFETLKDMKQKSVISVYTGIVWSTNTNELHVCTEGGRCVRPLYIVKDNELALTSQTMNELKNKMCNWGDIVTGASEGKAIIEFLDVEEGNTSMIAMKYSDLFKGMKGSHLPTSYTHMEMHPSLILGVLAGSIPFSDHNQAPRNTYQSAMGKQAIGVYTTSYQSRFDTLGHVLNYPQKPIVYTNTSKIVHTDELPCGNNVIVAIATYTGFNQEDSIIMNKSAVDRGMFVSTYYRTFKEQNNKNHSSGEEEYFCKPDMTSVKNMKPFNYNKLDDNGFVPENTFVESGDIIIGKCMPNKNGNVIINKDTSVVLKANEMGFIDKNACNDSMFTNTNGDGYTFCKVRLRSDRHPTIGDKFCVPGDVEVLTTNGWIAIKHIQKGLHQVYQLDVSTNTAQFGEVLDTYKFEHDGEMLHAVGDTYHIECTLDHRMLIKKSDDNEYALVKAKDAHQMSGFVFKKTAVHHKPAVISSPPESLMNVFGKNIKSIAMYLGAWYHSGTLSSGHITLRMTPNLLKYMSKQLSKHHIGHTIQYGQYINIYNEVLYKYCSDIQATDALPNFVADMADAEARQFIRFMFNDSMTKKVPQEQADALQRLILQGGMCCDMNETTITYYADDPQEPVQHVYTRPFSGHVYCIEVPTHVFYMRMQGKTMWTGNSSRHGQKGTVGMIYRQEDMPFTSEGISPDIIINPHAIPSRMTIAQLMECIMGKGCCMEGTYGDATPFTDISVEDLAGVLEKHGYERYGNEVLYNSRTGEQMPTSIFIGPTYYQRLKHMVNDKIHSRAANGPVVMLTRQPAEGRARDGGLRLGEMEIECNWAHGTMQFLKERFMECSDNFRVHICRKCGMIATVNKDKNIYHCKPCKNITSFAEIRIPYACKLLFQEIQTMSIGTKFIV